MSQKHAQEPAKLQGGVDPTLLLIVETEASKKAIGAALIQEVKTEEVIERRLIYTASRSLKPAETRYLTIRRELFGVSFALKKFRKFLMGNHFLVRTDNRTLDGLFKKAITSIEMKIYETWLLV
jgi:hypothetical protein